MIIWTPDNDRNDWITIWWARLVRRYRKAWMWLFNNVPLGRFAPKVLGWALGSKPKKVER